MSDLSKPPQMNIRDIPFEPGCIVALICVEPGAPLVAAGNVPPALIGAKWADVSTWAVLHWQYGICWAKEMKSEFGPPSLEGVLGNYRRYPESWTQVAINKGTA
jgi:hypothetical protein